MWKSLWDGKVFTLQCTQVLKNELIILFRVDMVGHWTQAENTSWTQVCPSN